MFSFDYESESEDQDCVCRCCEPPCPKGTGGPDGTPTDNRPFQRQTVLYAANSASYSLVRQEDNQFDISNYSFAWYNTILDTTNVLPPPTAANIKTFSQMETLYGPITVNAFTGAGINDPVAAASFVSFLRNSSNWDNEFDMVSPVNRGYGYEFLFTTPVKLDYWLMWHRGVHLPDNAAQQADVEVEDENSNIIRFSWRNLQPAVGECDLAMQIKRFVTEEATLGKVTRITYRRPGNATYTNALVDMKWVITPDENPPEDNTNTVLNPGGTGNITDPNVKYNDPTDPFRDFKPTPGGGLPPWQDPTDPHPLPTFMTDGTYDFSELQSLTPTIMLDRWEIYAPGGTTPIDDGDQWSTVADGRGGSFMMVHKDHNPTNSEISDTGIHPSSISLAFNTANNATPTFPCKWFFETYWPTSVGPLPTQSSILEMRMKHKATEVDELSMTYRGKTTRFVVGPGQETDPDFIPTTDVGDGWSESQKFWLVLCLPDNDRYASTFEPQDLIWNSKLADPEVSNILIDRIYAPRADYPKLEFRTQNNDFIWYDTSGNVITPTLGTPISYGLTPTEPNVNPLSWVTTWSPNNNYYLPRDQLSPIDDIQGKRPIVMGGRYRLRFEADGETLPTTNFTPSFSTHYNFPYSPHIWRVTDALGFSDFDKTPVFQQTVGAQSGIVARIKREQRL